MVVSLRECLRSVARADQTGAVALLIATAVALVWASSPWRASYDAMLEASVGGMSFRAFVDDGLMTIFFLAAGLEIRREAHDGALADRRSAALPLAAALGGMAVPALAYALVAMGTPHGRGWGVPMATDIAFAVGVLALLGARVPGPVRTLLLALAVIDDVGASLVIAIGYADGLAWGGLVVAAVGVGAVLVAQRVGVRRVRAYFPAAAVVWWGFHLAGIHPALSGVVIGLLTPPVASEVEARSPLERVHHVLVPWVSLGVMPLFALVSTGVSLTTLAIDAERWPIAIGIALGLALGKPVGIALGCALAVRAGLARLPDGLDARGVALVGLAGGIGLTMSLVIAELAFADELDRDVARVGVLAGSAVSAVVVLTLGRWLARQPAPSKSR